jgi:hypothetical protein
MRSPACQYGLSLTALLALPLFGAGARVEARFLRVDPSQHRGILAEMLEGSSSSVPVGTVGEPRSESSGPADEERPQEPARLALRSLEVWQGFGSTNTSCGSPSGFVSHSGSGTYVAVSEQVGLPPLQMAGWLFLDEVQSRPPPFASRLFRPPRES